MKAFILAEHSDAARALSAGARTFADEVIFIAIGSVEVPDSIADRVAHIELPGNAAFDDAADTVVAYFDSEKPEVVFIEPTRRLKAIAGKLSAHAETSTITDASSLEEGIAESLYFGGVGVRRLKVEGRAIYTIASKVFEDAQASGSNTVEEIAWVSPKRPLKIIASKPIEKSGVDLFKADVVVGAGRGFAEENDLDLARDLCNKIGAGLGCSRPLTEGVDWLPSEVYIGVSGLMLTPKIYIAVGISGQMQHMVGCNRAQTIFAINKDKNAPIFKQCDYGLVGDIKDVLPALNAAL